MKKILILITILAGMLAAGAALPAHAAPQTPARNGQALEIAPPVLTLTADPGEKVTAKIKLRDISKGKLIVTNEITDFTASGEDGTPKLLQPGESSPYSLRDWIQPLPQLLLNPRQVKSLDVTVNVPANASPGGYYGVVRFTAIPPDQERSGVSLSASLGALVFVKVNGKAHEAMSIEDFSVKHGSLGGPVLESAPLTFTEKLKNTGNMFEKPAGQVIITDMFGKEVGRVNVNLEGGYVLPDSTREFSQEFDESVIGNKFLFGFYKAHLEVTYGSDKQIVTSDISFWVIPYRLIGIIILVLIVGFFVLRNAVRRYNKHIIQKSQKKSRR